VIFHSRKGLKPSLCHRIRNLCKNGQQSEKREKITWSVAIRPTREGLNSKKGNLSKLCSFTRRILSPTVYKQQIYRHYDQIICNKEWKRPRRFYAKNVADLIFCILTETTEYKYKNLRATFGLRVSIEKKRGLKQYCESFKFMF
jgi:hypothetical protein